jgi:hypothetical protein
MSILKIALLGPPEVSHLDRRLTFPDRKALALLAYFAAEGGMHEPLELFSIGGYSTIHSIAVMGMSESSPLQRRPIHCSAINSPDGWELASGRTFEVWLGGAWHEGHIERREAYGGYFFVSHDGGYCGLCTGMRVRALVT